MELPTPVSSIAVNGRSMGLVAEGDTGQSKMDAAGARWGGRRRLRPRKKPAQKALRELFGPVIPLVRRGEVVEEAA